MNLTLVAYYGPKQQGKVRELIETTQSLLRDQLKTAFDGYVLEQVHGTIIGLEGVRVGDVVMNANFLRRRQLQKAFHLETAIEIALGVRGFDVRIGGFKDGDAYPFTLLPSGSGESAWKSFLLWTILPESASTQMT